MQPHPRQMILTCDRAFVERLMLVPDKCDM
jgi:hypothetical protein